MRSTLRVLLIRRTKQAQLCLTDPAKQVDEVEGGLIGGLRAVFDVVGHVEPLPEPELRRGEHVVRHRPRRLCQLPDSGVPLIDQLTTMLRDL